MTQESEITRLWLQSLVKKHGFFGVLQQLAAMADLGKLIEEHGVVAVVQHFTQAAMLEQLSTEVMAIALGPVLDANGGSRGSINFQAWERAALLIDNAAVICNNLATTTCAELPPYPPFHS